MAKALSNTARTIFAAAAARADLHLLPLPTSLRAPQVAIRTTISTLIRKGMVAEVPAGRNEPTWEHSEAASPITLIATALGLEALGAPQEVTATAEPDKRAKAARKGVKAKAAGIVSARTAEGPRRATSGARARSAGSSKQDSCIALLRREMAPVFRR